FFFFSSRRRHTRLQGDWSSDVCSSDLSIRCRCIRARPNSLRASAARSTCIPISEAMLLMAFHGSQSHLCKRRCRLSSTKIPTRRSEERRVGKECRSRVSKDHRKGEEGE